MYQYSNSTCEPTDEGIVVCSGTVEGVNTPESNLVRSISDIIDSINIEFVIFFSILIFLTIIFIIFLYKYKNSYKKKLKKLKKENEIIKLERELLEQRKHIEKLKNN